MIALILDTIDKFSQYKSPRHFAHYAGEEAANTYEDIASYLYLLLGKFPCVSQFHVVLIEPSKDLSCTVC